MLAGVFVSTGQELQGGAEQHGDVIFDDRHQLLEFLPHAPRGYPWKSRPMQTLHPTHHHQDMNPDTSMPAPLVAIQVGSVILPLGKKKYMLESEFYNGLLAVLLVSSRTECLLYISN